MDRFHLLDLGRSDCLLPLSFLLFAFCQSVLYGTGYGFFQTIFVIGSLLAFAQDSLTSGIYGYSYVELIADFSN